MARFALIQSGLGAGCVSSPIISLPGFPGGAGGGLFGTATKGLAAAPLAPTPIRLPEIREGVIPRSEARAKGSESSALMRRKRGSGAWNRHRYHRKLRWIT